MPANVHAETSIIEPREQVGEAMEERSYRHLHELVELVDEASDGVHRTVGIWLV